MTIPISPEEKKWLEAIKVGWAEGNRTDTIIWSIAHQFHSQNRSAFSINSRLTELVNNDPEIRAIKELTK